MSIASGASGGYPGSAGVAIGAGQTPAAPTNYGNATNGPTFIPEIWSGKLLEKFYDATVLAAISNTDYEGEIRNQGDTVHIRQRPDITISNYTPDTELAVQRPNAPIVDLTIDFAKYFNTIVDDVYEVQADMDMMSMWAEDASEQMKITIDSEVLASIFLGGSYTNTSGVAEPDGSYPGSNNGSKAGRISADINLGITTAPLVMVPRAPTAGQTEVTDLIVSLGQVLDEQNIPENGRWIIIPAWMSAMIKKSELRDVSLSGDGTSMLRNGRLGMIDRFTIYMSNLLPSGTNGGLAAGETAMFAGHSIAPTFASQLSKMETIRSERTFGTLMRGLQVYGCDIVKGEGLVEAIVSKP